MKYLDALATFWQRNAEIRHGHLPRTGDVQGPVAAAGQSLLAKSLPYIVTTLLGGGGVAAVPWLLDLFVGRDDPPAVVQPAEQEKDGSLYQYLEDRGDHLPQ